MTRRYSPIFALLACVLSIGTAATMLEASSPSMGATAPAELGRSGGPSLLKLLFSLLGVSMGGVGSPTGGLASLLSLLVAAAEAVARMLVPLVAVGLLLVGTALAAKRVLRVRGSSDAPDELDADAAPDRFRPADASNDAYRAWSAMVRRLDAEDARARTAVEWAEIAREQGLDSDAVEDVTRSFRTVRYGNERIAPERRRRLRRESERFESASGTDR